MSLLVNVNENEMLMVTMYCLYVFAPTSLLSENYVAADCFSLRTSCIVM